MRVEAAVLGPVGPNEPSGFRGREALLNRASALSQLVPNMSTNYENIKQHYLPTLAS